MVDFADSERDEKPSTTDNPQAVTQRVSRYTTYNTNNQIPGHELRSFGLTQQQPNKDPPQAAVTIPTTSFSHCLGDVSFSRLQILRESHSPDTLHLADHSFGRPWAFYLANLDGVFLKFMNPQTDHLCQPCA